MDVSRGIRTGSIALTSSQQLARGTLRYAVNELDATAELLVVRDLFLHPLVDRGGRVAFRFAGVGEHNCTPIDQYCRP